MDLKRWGTLIRTMFDPCMNSRHICITICGVKITISHQCLHSPPKGPQDISYIQNSGEIRLRSYPNQANHGIEVFPVFIHVLIYPVMNASRF